MFVSPHLALILERPLLSVGCFIKILFHAAVKFNSTEILLFILILFEL